MTSPQSKSISFAKVIVFFAVAFGIGLGLCGLDYFLAARGIGKRTIEYGVGPLDGVSLVVMILSAVGLILTTVLWIVVAIIRGITRRGADSPQSAEAANDRSPTGDNADGKKDDQ